MTGETPANTFASSRPMGTRKLATRGTPGAASPVTSRILLPCRNGLAQRGLDVDLHVSGHTASARSAPL